MLRHKMVIVWSEENNCYLVHLPDFPEQLYLTGGNSYAEAAQNGEEVLQLLLKEDKASVEASKTAAPAPQPLSTLARSPQPPSEGFISIESEPEAKPEEAEPEGAGPEGARPEEALEATDASIVPSKATVQQAVSSPSPKDQLSSDEKKPTFAWLPTAFASLVTSVVSVAALTALAFVSEGFTSQQPASTAPATEQADAKSEIKTASSILPPLSLTKSVAESSEVWAIATYSDMSRNISLIVSGNETGQIVIRDQTSGQPVRTIEAHDDKVRAIAIAPQSRRLVSSSGDGIKVWNLDTGEPIYSLSSPSPVWSIAIAPDENRFISSAYDGNIAAWDLATGKELYSIGVGATVWSVAISPSGESFVSGDSDRTIRQWNLATGEPLRTFKGHQGDVRALAISPNGKTLASGSWDKTIKLWSLETGELKATLEGHRDRVVTVAISDDGKTLASGSVDATVRRWQLSDYQLIDTLDDPFDWVLSVAFAKDQTLITGGKDKELKIWQPEG